MAITILATNLAKLAGPIGENTGKTSVRQAGVGGAAAAVETATDSPAAIDAIFGIGIEAESVLGLKNVKRRKLVAGAPEEFSAEQERMVDGAAERLPTESGVSRIKVGQKIRGVKNRAADAGGVVAASVGTAEVDVGRFAEVAVEAKMADNAGVLAAVGGENVTRIASENLGRSLEEPVFRGGQEARKGNAGIVDAVFAADEIVGHQRPVDERQGMIVDGVDLAEFGAHFSHFQKEPGGERSKGDVTFLDVHAFFAEGDKGIGARVGIDDGLHADFGLVEFERARWRNGVAPGSADEIADQADVGIEELGVGGRAAIGLRLRNLCGRHRLRRGCRGCGAGEHARLHSRG